MNLVSLTSLAESEKAKSFNNIDPSPFMLICPSGNKLICDWIDGYYGFFVPRGEKSFLRVNQIDFRDTECCIPLD